MPAGALSRCFSAALARALAGVGASLALVAATAAPTASPQPRVVYEMHTARINQIRATPDLTRLITVSQDKTLRVWRVADLALMRSIAVPSEGGEEGALRSLAITPDGREVIVGGWTGLAWTQGQQAQAYRFDLASGQLRQVYRGFPALIESMAISADGRRLAIGLGGGAGLRVLDWSSGRELWADSEYGERVGFADFSVDGTLATTSADGCLRLYTPQGQLVFRAEYPPRQDGGPACRGSALGGVRFSPDGRQLAFGLQDRVEIVVMDVGSRQFRHRLRVDDPGQRSLCCPNWSADGQRLHMHGAYDGDGPTPLYRITLASGQLDRLSVGRQRFTNVLPLPDGELLVSTTTPSLARIGRDGTVLAEKLPPNIDFQFAWDQWRMDRTGARLSLPVDGPGRDRRIFDVGAPPDRAYTVATSTDEAGLEAPSRGAGLAVEAWLDSFGYQRPVRVAGQPLRLKPFQSVRSWASDKLRAALGTQWSVLVADASARIVWEQDLPAPAYQVHLSRDGRFVVAAVGDGSLRWYDAATGTERLGAFLHVNGRDWIAWRPDGFYASSPGGDEYLGWLVNRGDDQEPDLLRAVQFERSLYRPDLLQAALEAPDVPRSNGNGRAPTLAALSAPRVRITSIDAEARKVAFTVHAGGSPVREIGVYADGIPILGGGSRTVGGASGSFSSTVAIPRGLPLDRIRVEAMSSASFGLDEAAALHPQPATTGRGTLWVVAVGVEKYPVVTACPQGMHCGIPVPELPNAPNDAAVLVQRLRESSQRQFADFRSQVVAHGVGKEPNKANILAALRTLEAARPEDTVVVFLASHGFAGGAEAPEYYFLPADTDPGALARITAEASGAPIPVGTTTTSLLTATELNDALRRVPGRRVLVIDTCHSGAAVASSNPYALAKRSAAAQYAVLAASTGEELSAETADPSIRHGAFTHALITALRGDADSDGDGGVTLQEAFRFVLPAVRKNAEKIDAARRAVDPYLRPFTQTPTLHGAPALLESMLAGVAQATKP